MDDSVSDPTLSLPVADAAGPARPGLDPPVGGLGIERIAMMILMRSGSLTIDAELSTVSEIALKPTQQLE